MFALRACSAICLLGSIAAPALADAAAVRAVVAVARAGAGQAALAVGFDERGVLRARLCAESCTLDGGARELPLPPSVRAHAHQAELSVIAIGLGRRVIRVVIPDAHAERRWEAVLAAPLVGSEPLTIFSGFTGLISGEEGERSGPMLFVSEPADDGRRLVIGEQREDLDLCGRPAVLAPKLLDPRDLTLRPAKVQRLSAAERSHARRVTARRLSEPNDSPRLLLRALAASSAVGDPAALTDGDVETTWSENRGGSGRGEFVLMSAPAELPLRALELVVRPPKRALPNGVAPREFFVVTRSDVVSVTLPEDAWHAPGARYAIPLEPPLKSDCLALVTDTAYGEQPAARVTFAELAARTEFDGVAPAAVAAALAGGGERARAAAEMLRGLGDPGFAAVAAAFEGLDESGRRLALDVLDGAPCAASAPVYVSALLGRYRAQRSHAHDHLQRCGEASAGALEAALGRLPRRAAPVLANELALVAPARAVTALVPLLDGTDPVSMRELRRALGRAALSPSADAQVRAELGARAGEPRVALELLRALGPSASRFVPEAPELFARLTAGARDFRARYLLVEPAAILARVDARAARYWSECLANDSEPAVRTHAAELAPELASFTDELLRALGDASVRVREASVNALARARSERAGPSLAELLRRDPWPLVRARAAEALAALPPARASDRALAKAVADPSPHVRVPALQALAAHRVGSAAELIRARLLDHEEALLVRVAAARALGELCDGASVAALSAFARRLGEPQGDAESRIVAPAALEALARLHPADLAARLAPLHDPRAPAWVRAAAERAERTRPVCGPVGQGARGTHE